MSQIQSTGWFRVLSLILLSVSACHDTTPYGMGTACGSGVECRSPLVCQSGLCVLEMSGGASSQSVLTGGTASDAAVTGGTSQFGSATVGSLSVGGTTSNANDSGGSTPLATVGSLSVGGTTSNANNSGGTTPLATGGVPTGGQGSGGMSTVGQNTGGTSTEVQKTVGMSTGGISSGGTSSSPPLLRDVGESCDGNDQCQSTHCVDLVCCNLVCDGQCQGCNLQSNPGHCASLSSGQPVGGRTPCNNASTTCGGSCQGSIGCTYPDATQPCDNKTGCIDSTTLQVGTACDGTGSCTIPITRACGQAEVCNINTDNNCGKASYVQVDVSDQHSCAVVSDGSLRCWGSNALGQLGVDASGIQSVPTPVPNQQYVRSVATGWGHTCALHQDGHVDCWGIDFNGDVGCPNPLMLTTPQKCTPFSPGKGVVEIAAGGEHSCARLGNGRIKCWGLNAFGEVGNGKLPTPGSVDANAYTPVDVVGITDAREIAAGVWDACAILSNGALRCWGNNDGCNLGTGDWTGHASPTPVSGIDGSANGSAISVAATSEHTCSLMNDGSVRCFGSNSDGQLGDGTTSDSCYPIAAQLPIAATAIAVGGQFSCALTIAGSIHCWGTNGYGQLGNGSYVASLEPALVQLPSAINFKTIVSKYYHSCALSTEGSLWCWGDNSYGQLGNGTLGEFTFPVEAGAAGGQ